MSSNKKIEANELPEGVRIITSGQDVAGPKIEFELSGWKTDEQELGPDLPTHFMNGE